MSTTRILDGPALAAVVADVGLERLLDELIDTLRTTVAAYDPEQLPTFDRAGYHYTKPGLGLIEWMPAMDLGRLVAVKMVGYHPSNPVERGEPSVLASTSLYDTSSGRLLALVEATMLTALRTGAASAVVTDVLAPPDVSTLGLVGCGAQAVTQAHAISRVRPIDRLLVFDVDADVAHSLAARLPFGDEVAIEVVQATQLGRLVADSDVICTATTVGIGEGAVLPDGEHRPWLHVNAVGADFAGKREIPDAMLRRAVVVPDVTAQCILEGECQGLDRSEIGPDMARLLATAHEARQWRDRLTVFDSTGWSLEDLVAAELVVAHADRLGVGAAIDLQPTPTDPYDPYEFVR